MMSSGKKTREEFSRDVYEAFQDIAVTSDMIQRRRHGRLLVEIMHTTGCKLTGLKMSPFLVGSQTEGSTTKGMMSDADTVINMDAFQVVLKLGAWQTGKVNLLAFKDETTPPQFYKICILRPTPDGRQDYMNMTEPVHNADKVHVDEKGRLLLSNLWDDDNLKSVFKEVGFKNVFIKNGPSRSHYDKLDMVDAFPCKDFPEECDFLFQRPRAGHWPKPETLEYAKQCPVFFIPQGHPHSELKERNLQWRLSTTLTERALMFSFTEVQMLVYILLKMLKIENIKPKFGDNFSTFHIKTAMMFTVERYHPEIWCIDNIVLCATYCIDTLIQWAHERVCPHFTMGGVNLFDGKLSESDIKELAVLLTDLNKSIVEYVCNLKMDLFGMRLLQKVHDQQDHQIEVIREIHYGIKSSHNTVVKDIQCRANTLDVMAALQFVINTFKYFRGQQTNGSELQREAADLFLPFVYGTLASIMASICIVSRGPVMQDVIKLYQLSFESDLMSGKLKYASMLYSGGQYDQAADMLNHCEGLLGPDVAHYCVCFLRRNAYEPESFIKKSFHTDMVELLKTSSTMCIMFCKHDLPRVPEHLRYEMFRTQTQKDKNERHKLNIWMDLVVIDCVPFLYFLQYLVSSKKGQLPRRLSAMFHLINYLAQRLTRRLHKESAGHVETALHVLAHCWELENRPDVAWHLYQQSINIFPTNNIAWVHLIRLFQKIFLRFER